MLKTTTIVLALVATAGSATAQGDRLSDAAFVKASRCEGLIASSQLGGGDASNIHSFLKVQSRGRGPEVSQFAERARQSASEEARRAKGGRRDALIAERDGACKMLTA